MLQNVRIGVFWTRYNPVKTGVWSRRRKSTVWQKMSVFWCASVGSYTNQKPTIIKEFGVVVQRGIVRYMTDWTVIFPVGKGKIVRVGWNADSLARTFIIRQVDGIGTIFDNLGREIKGFWHENYDMGLPCPFFLQALRNCATL